MTFGDVFVLVGGGFAIVFQFDSCPDDFFFVLKDFFHFFGNEGFVPIFKIEVETGENQVVLHMCLSFCVINVWWFVRNEHSLTSRAENGISNKVFIFF